MSCFVYGVFIHYALLTKCCSEICNATYRLGTRDIACQKGKYEIQIKKKKSNLLFVCVSKDIDSGKINDNQQNQVVRKKKAMKNM